MRKKSRKLVPVFAVAAIIIIIILFIFLSKIIDKYTPTKERMDLTEYYKTSGEGDTAILLNNELTDSHAIYKDGMIYLSYQVVHDLFNSRFYWDGNENLLLYTTPDALITVAAGSNEYLVTKEKNTETYTICYADGDTSYIAIDFVEKYTNMTHQHFGNPNRIVVTTDFGTVSYAAAKKDSHIRVKGGIKSPILCDLKKGDEFTLLEEGEDWAKVAREDGIVGYLQNKYVGEKKEKTISNEFKEPQFTHIKKDKKINMAWHQVTTQEANATVTDMVRNTKGLNVISPTWFYLNDNNGTLYSLADSDYVNYCHQNDIEVWALVSNLENKDVDTTEILTHTSKRSNVINQLIASAIQYDFDGINVDFEALSGDVGDGFIQFIRELSLKCANNGIVLSVDNYVPTDYTAFYNRREQANFADYVVVMAYDEHYAGSEEEGSVASMGFVNKGITDTIESVPAEQIILGVPLYTRIWMQTPKESTGDDVESAQEGYEPYDLSSKAVGMKEAVKMIDANGAQMTWLEEEGQNYAEYINEGITYKIWLEDAKSIEEKLKSMASNQLAGASFWKLGFEDASLWDTVIKYMN